MTKKFIKMHGLGNDFVIFDARQEKIEIFNKKIRELGDRRRGIGFDQMIIIDSPKTSMGDAFFRIYNIDGSEVGACGNATRCIAKLISKELNKQDVILETSSNILYATVSQGEISVDMGEPKLKYQEIPLSKEIDTISLPISEGELKNPVAVNIGNPHAVFFVENVDEVNLSELGSKIEDNPLFPEKTNVEIAQVISKSKIRMRVWERGTGITEACGTGACAVVAAAIRRGLTNRQVTVILDGGELKIEWRESDNHIIMSGYAVEVYRGEVKL